jgi:hypothetical protein
MQSVVLACAAMQGCRWHALKAACKQGWHRLHCKQAAMQAGCCCCNTSKLLLPLPRRTYLGLPAPTWRPTLTYAAGDACDVLLVVDWCWHWR